MEQEKKEINWRAAEYEYAQKGAGWYWVLGGICTALVVIALWQKNFFFALFIILAGLIILSLGKKRPEIFEFSLTNDKVKIGERVSCEYKDFENFSVRERPGRLDELILKKKALVNPYLRLPIDSKLAVRAKSFLREKLPEVEHQESLIDIISEWLKL